MQDDRDEEDEEHQTNKNDHLKYFPASGTSYFWYKKWPFLFKRSVLKSRDFDAREQLAILTFGRDPGIIKKLLKECKQSWVMDKERTTIVYRPDGNYYRWSRYSARISRPMSTVILDTTVKNSLVKDLGEYLNSGLERWSVGTKIAESRIVVVISFTDPQEPGKPL